MSPEEINKKAKEAFPNGVDNERDTAMLRLGFETAYEGISSLPTIKGWVARDMNKQALYFYTVRPTRGEHVWSCPPNSCCPIKDKKVFPDLKWEDEPIEVDLPIIRK